MERQGDPAQGDETIGRLIAAAGPGHKASAEARARVYAAVHSEWQASVRRQRTTVGRTATRRHWAALAASVVGAVALYSWLAPGGRDDSARIELALLSRIQGAAELIRDGATVPLDAAFDGTAAREPVAIHSGDVLRTGGDGRIALGAGAGLEVRVDVNSEILLADAATIELRAGTIYIDAGTAGNSPPLEVSTSFGSVVHVGTQYEVQLGSAALRLRVREGVVRFSDLSGDAVTGTAGEQLDIAADGTIARGNVATDDPGWVWTTTLATLPQADAHSLGEVLRWLAREQGLTLEPADDELAARLDTEMLVGLDGLTPAEAFDVLERTTDFSFSIGSGRLRVTD